RGRPARRTRPRGAPPRPARPSRRGQYDAPPADAPSSSGPWGRTRIPQTEAEPAPPPKKPRLREAEPPTAPTPTAPKPPTPTVPKAPAGRRSDSIGTTIAKTATRTVTNVLVREATKAVMTNGGSILRGVLGSILK